MNKKSFLLSIALVFIVSVNVFAQVNDSLALGGLAPSSILDQISLWLGAALALYEIVARLVPTVKDISLLNKIITLIQWIVNLIPNKKPGGGTH